MPTVRYNHACVVIANKIFVLGGQSSHLECLDTVEYYNLAKNKWFAAAPMLQPRCEHKAVALNEFVYVLGGFKHDVGFNHSGWGYQNTETGFIQSIDRYSVDENQWIRVSKC